MDPIMHARSEEGTSRSRSDAAGVELPDVLESITDGFHLVDATGRFTRFNTAARAIYAAQGLDADGLIGRNVFEVFPGLESSAQGEPMRLALAGGANSFELEYAPWKRWFSIRHYPLAERGVATFFLDITERKRSEEELRASQHLYRALVEVSPQTVWYGRADGSITFVNQHWLTYSGMTVEQSLGSGWTTAIDPAHRERVVAAWLKAAPVGQWEFEIPFLRHDGQSRWHLARGLASRNEEGEIDRWIGIAVDVHERKQAQEAVRRSEEKYRTLFDSMDEGYCVIEILFDEQGRANDWRFVETNPAFNQQNPIPGMAIGKRMTELVPAIEPKWFDIYGRVAVTGEPIRFTEDSDALGRCFDLYAFRIGGESSRTVAVLFTNITQRTKAERALRETEARFRALTTASSYVVYRMNADWSQAREVDGRNFLMDTLEPRENWMDHYLLQEDHAAIWAVIQQAIATRTMFHLEHRVRRVDGSVGWTISRAVPLLGEGGEITEWFGVASDITERKLAEEALRKTEKLAVVGRLAATISHEINNPLEAVMNLIYLIQGETDAEAIQAYAATAQRELSRVSHIVTHTLQYNRQSTTATEERLSALIESALAIYDGRLAVSGISLLRDYDAADSVLCYASELRQVFTNFIGNAFDATRLGGTLTLRTRRRRHQSSRREGVSVVIADTGHGMGAETRKRLFEPFFTTKGMNGTGLGVWVSKSILDKHGARFRVSSSQEAGKSGTVWAIWLPRTAEFQGPVEQRPVKK